jgi:hypothetical protein
METIKLQEWNVDKVITTLIDEEWFEKTALCGLTYREIEELEKYNN